MKAQVNGISINYEVSGTEGKPWITFAHALCNNLTLWDDQEALLRDDYRILRYDHRGLGQSDAPEGPYTFPMIIADALALMDHVGVDKTHWCGLSIGGMMGYGLAQDHGDRLLSLIACDSRPDAPPDYQDYFQHRIDVAGRLTDNPEQLARFDELRQRYPAEGNWIRFGYLKGFIDGTLGSGTALFFEPFEDEPDKSGLAMMPYDELERRVVASDAAGFQIGIHAIGSRANNWILNAYEKAREVNGVRDSRHRSEHAQILIDEDIPRFAELGVIASMQPTHCITDKRFCEKRIGLERSAGAYAWRRLLDAGVHIAFGTDYTVEPLEPMEGLYAAVTRKDRAGEEGDGWFPDQKLTMEEAIELYTLGAAYAQFMEDRKGMLREGYLADMLILDRDLFTIPEEEIMTTNVDYTIVGGKVVYEREGGR